jgi:hypothetical protein
MASKTTRVSLPDTPETLRFYLEGVHHFIQWCEAEIEHSTSLTFPSPGRLFIAIQQILESYSDLRGGPEGRTAFPTRAYPSVSFAPPFEISPAFLAIRPFLDREKIAANLAKCRDAVEAMEPIPCNLIVQSLPIGRSRIRMSKARKLSDLSVEEREVIQKEATLRKRRVQEQLAAIRAAFERLLAPFQDLSQNIIRKLGGVDDCASGCVDASAMLPASQLVGRHERISTYKKLKRLVDQNPDGIRTEKPNARRLNIHVGDLFRLLKGGDGSAFEKVDSTDGTDKASKAFRKEAASRQRQIRRTRGLPEADNYGPSL